jgi:hypothetical protein
VEATPLAAGTGWPFLVAAGRRRDYTVVLAPEFMIAAGEAGRLGDVVAAGKESDPAQVISIATPTSCRLAIAYRTHLLTAADLADSDHQGRSTDPHDAHNRPLRLAFGFVTPWLPDSGAALDTDVESCRPVALSAYRRFLDDESGFTVQPSGAVPIHCADSPARSDNVGSGNGAPVTAAPPLPPSAQPGAGPGKPPPRAGLRRAVVAGLVGAVLGLLLVLLLATRNSATPNCPTPTPTATGYFAGHATSSTCSPEPAE